MSNVRPLVRADEFTPPSTALFSWKRAVLAVILWPVGCSLVGFLIATASGEHGSIIFLGLGVLVGVAGASAHAGLLLIARFRRVSSLGQTLLVWATTAVILMALAIAFAMDSNSPSKLREALGFIFLYAALPALVAATVFNWLVNRAAA
jgi:ABC-type sugar transport system permease subunit